MFLSRPSGEDFSVGSCGLCDFGLRAAGLVGLLGAWHGQDDVAAPAGQADHRGVVAFAFVSFSFVERFGLRARSEAKAARNMAFLSR